MHKYSPVKLDRPPKPQSRMHKHYRKKKRQLPKSFDQLPKIYGPMCMRFSPSLQKRPQTNQSQSLDKPRRGSVPQRKRYYSKVDLQSKHKVQFKQSFFRGLPPIPQASEQQPQPQIKAKKVFRSTTKYNTQTHTIQQPTPNHSSSNKRTMIFDTDLSNEDDVYEGIQTVAKLTRPPRKRKHLTGINFPDTPNKTTQSLFASSTCVDFQDEDTEFVKRKQIDGASALRQLLKKSIRSDVFRIRLPEKMEDIPQFIKNYKVVNTQLEHISEMPGLTVIPYKNLKALYFGEGKSGDHKIREGLGVYVCQTYIFQGKFHEDVKVQGVQINHQGIYCGNFKENRRNGQGQFQWYNGESYTGNWVDNLKHGEGIWRKPNGQSYAGEWKNNTIEGRGKYQFDSQHYYQGQFIGFSKHGKGFQRFANDQSYEGDYKQGLPDGKGKYSWSDMHYYQGQWKKGLREGYGKQVKGMNWIYQGQFLKDKRHGHGQLLTNSQTFTGVFENNRFTKGSIKNNNTGQIRNEQKSQKPSYQTLI